MRETDYCPPQGTEVTNLYIFSRQRSFYPEDGSSSYPNFSKRLPRYSDSQTRRQYNFVLRFPCPCDFLTVMSMKTDSRTYSPCGEPENFFKG